MAASSPPDPVRWSQVNRLFEVAITRPPDERATFLAAQCGSDLSLRAEVESLLAAHRDEDTGVRPGVVVGSRLGDYDVTGFIAAGGMGEVYRARDAKLGRDVALKILPAAFVADLDRRARFEREARLLASLNHPHIATIHGFVEQAGTSALVLELVEGDTLADRIARGPIPLDEALPIARQIAEALEAAHEQGIIHRDLKPANIKVREDGTVKVLDFGLAKLNDSNVSNGPNALPMSPTVTSPAMTTGAGVLLGTAAYMSPEQAKGREADKRSDVWAFGAVLYEMLNGRRAFDGEDTVDVLSRVLQRDPDWTALPANVPPSIRALLRRCLEKDRRKRVADIAVALFALDEHASLGGLGTAASASRRSLRHRLAIPGALLAGALAASAIFVVATQRPTARTVTRLTLSAPADAPVAYDDQDRSIAISPDGSRVAYTSASTPVYRVADVQLFVRALEQLQPTLLAGPGYVREPSFSPDGAWVAFFEPYTRLQKVSATGGPPVPIATTDGSSRGATWGADNTIIFATTNTATGLQQVSANGGEPKILTRPSQQKGERDHLWPHFLPGGRAVLFTIVPAGPIENAQIAVLDLRDGSQKVVVQGGSDARYVEGGYLVYGVAGTLRAVPFDLDRLDVRGTPVPVLQQVVTTSTVGAANFAVANNGTLSYVSGSVVSSALLRRELVWVDQKGRSAPLFDRSASYRAPRLSPDGKRIVVGVTSPSTSGPGNPDIWVLDIESRTQTRLTSEPGNDSTPLWTPDGKRVTFSSNRAGGANALYWMSADGTGAPEPLTKASTNQFATSWSSDGRTLVFYDTGGNMDMLTMKPREAPVRFLETRFRELGPMFSPDGRWLAYSSDETGREEVYLTPYPGPGGRIEVSTAGGRLPTWSRDGRELFYRNGPQMMAVAITPGPTLGVGPPTLLFEGDYVKEDGVQGFRDYDVSPDGQRFLMMKEADDYSASPPQIIIIQNWLEELKRLVPSN